MPEPTPPLLLKVLDRARDVVETDGRAWTVEHGSGFEHNVPCPAHNDHHPSASIGWSAEKRQILLRCHATCSQDEVRAALGFTWGQLSESTKSTFVCAYDYADEENEIVFQVVRYEPKAFRQRQLNPDWREGRPVAKKWLYKVSNLPELRTLPYRLPELLKALRTGENVHIVEGEKDADVLAAHGAIATCNAGGAGKWTDAHSEWFRGSTSRVVVIADRDAAGYRHVASVAASLARVGVTAELVEAAGGKDAAEHISHYGLDDFEPVSPDVLADALTASGTAAAEADGGVPLTDLGNAERFVTRHGEDCRYLWQPDTWLVWDGRRWVADDSGQVQRWMKQTVRAIRAEAQKGARSWAERSESAARIDAALKLARSEAALRASAADFDARPDLLNVANGTVDLRTGDLREHRREDYLMQMVGVEFDRAAEAPEFERFLATVQPDPEMRAFLQRAAGYSATGHTSEQKFLLLHSAGQSGKSTLVETLYRLFGDYATTLPAEALVQRSGDRIPSDIARLAGRRYATVSEFDDSATLNERLIKQLTGGDTVTARFMYKDFFEFRPQSTIWVSSNHRPVVRGVDEGVWRRHLLVPFPVQIVAEARDDHLGERIRANELPGVLRWVVEGAREWYRQGLNPPRTVLDATASYREDSDLLGGFLDEECELGAGHSVPKADLYARYVEWCRDGGLRPATKIAFGRLLKERPDLRLTDDRIGKYKVWVWVGLDFRPSGRVLQLAPARGSEPEAGRLAAQSDRDGEAD